MSDSVDLTNCDREPIHKLGAIQPFGALIAANRDWAVVSRSANLEEILCLDDSLPLEAPLAAWFSSESFKVVRSRLNAASETGEVERVFGIDLFGDKSLFDLALHCSGDLAVVELEVHDSASISQHTGMLRPIMARLERCDSVQRLCDEAATILKRLLGFDRVMVYKFHPDDSGEVIAEAREAQLEAFLGLRYPQSDIPQQARALYLRNLFRIIADVEDEPVPLVPSTAPDGQPIDLSMSTLRAVSPIHIEYLRNMGVRASLSISIVINGKLWGLFACHHYAPRVLPYSLRTVAELFSQLFSLQLSLVIAKANTALAERGRYLRDRLMARAAKGGAPAETLRAIGEIVADVIPHDGSSAFVEGVYRARGSAPTEEQFRALLPALYASSTQQVVTTDAAAKLWPQAERFADRAVGALVIPVSRRPQDYVVLWRRELPQTVTWAGHPEKPVEVGPHGSRLTPRKSFEAWQESVRGQSAAWSAEEVAIADGLRMTLLEVLLRLTEDVSEERERAHQQQELLIAELNHRVRNILTLIRGLVNQSRSQARDVEEFAEVIAGRIRALAMAHDNINRENWAAASLYELIRAEAEAYLGGKAGRVVLSGPDVLVQPEAYTVLALVLHEMMTNSAKYGSLCDSSGRLEIGTRIAGSGDLHISWRERGGPPVQAPTRRGFGTTIIERSIPHELRGEAEVRYKLGGVEARFVIPKRYVVGPAGAPHGKDHSLQTAETAPPRSAVPPAAIRRVLLVEDSMLIALDAEDALIQSGVADVAIAANVEAALREIDKAMPDFALLDFNLGDESSEPVAEALANAGVPFCFASGYGDALERMSIVPPFGVLKKPYSREEIAAVLGKAAARTASA